MNCIVGTLLHGPVSLCTRTLWLTADLNGLSMRAPVCMPAGVRVEELLHRLRWRLFRAYLYYVI